MNTVKSFLGLMKLLILSKEQRDISNNTTSSSCIISIPPISNISVQNPRVSIRRVTNSSKNFLGYKVAWIANKACYPTLVLKRVPWIERRYIVGKGKDKFLGSPKRNTGLPEYEFNIVISYA